MSNNDLLRRLRYALDLKSNTIVEIFALAGHAIAPAEVLKLLKKDDDPGFVSCDNRTMSLFLDGLITFKRGVQDGKPQWAPPSEVPLTNNLVLRKLRIALELNDEAMLAVLKRADVAISKSELSAMFRATGHRNYKECGDQFLRNFIRGLTLRTTSTT
jgi:uncharacterized protein YehS (DUF1456 family)